MVAITNSKPNQIDEKGISNVMLAGMGVKGMGRHHWSGPASTIRWRDGESDEYAARWCQQTAKTRGASDPGEECMWTSGEMGTEPNPRNGGGEAIPSMGQSSLHQHPPTNPPPLTSHPPLLKHLPGEPLTNNIPTKPGTTQQHHKLPVKKRWSRHILNNPE